MPSNTSNPGGFDPRGGTEPHRKVYANAHSDGLRAAKYMRWDRQFGYPIIQSFGTVGAPVTVPALPTAIQSQVSGITLPGALGCNYMEMHQTTAQTLMPSLHDSKGLEIALDQVDNEAVEYVLGGNRTSNPLGYLAGTDPGVFLRVTFEIPDADGIDQFGIFWRKQEAYVTPTSFLTTGDPIYTDIILFGFATVVTNPNALKVSYDLNNSGSSTILDPGFTVADNGLVTLESWLWKRKSKFFINGVPLGGRVAKDGIGAAIVAQNTTPVAEITVDAGDFMIPGIFCRQDTALSPLYVRNVTCGQLTEDGLIGGRV